jgi:hypothetical protein
LGGFIWSGVVNLLATLMICGFSSALARGNSLATDYLGCDWPPTKNFGTFLTG